MYIDVHCHLDLLKNLDSVIDGAKEAGVRCIVTAGIDSKTNRLVLSYAEKYEGVGAALGIYPDETLKLSESDLQKEIDFIRANANKIKAIGEIGIDWTYPDKEKQIAAFTKQVKLALELDKPIVVHSRKAEADAIDLLEQLNVKKCVMHYFSGNMKLVERIVQNGWKLSVPTCVVYSEQFQSLIANTPVENLLCETDSPFSHPKKKKGNEPGNVVESYKMIAKIKGLEIKKVEEQIEKNYSELF
tara:strand:- start:965 stop:1696 length:732 start_codon:yes stop_codon:yes gene_type:complete